MRLRAASTDGPKAGSAKLAKLTKLVKLLRAFSAAAIRAVEAVALELDRHRREHLAYLLFVAARAYGDRVVIERLVFGEVIPAVLATVMIGWQRSSSTGSGQLID